LSAAKEVVVLATKKSSQAYRQNDKDAAEGRLILFHTLSKTQLQESGMGN
jgi:hypothetical protein